MLQRSLRLSQSLQRCHVPQLPRPSRFAVTVERDLRPPRSLIHSRLRFYSTATGEESGALQSNEPSPPSKAPPEAVAVEEESLKKKVEAQAREIVDLKDKHLRSVADFQNLQERTKRDISSARDFAIEKFAKDLLDTTDNLERALSSVPAAAVAPPATDDASLPNKDLADLYDGLKMTEQVLMQTFAKHGLEKYDPAEKGEKFDPKLHEGFPARMEGKEDESILSTTQKGWFLNGRVVRAAKVVVVKNP